MSKLNLDRDQMDQCRSVAEAIVAPVQRYIDYHSTVSIERSVLRLFGVEGEGQHLPLVNEVVDKLDRRKLSLGASYWFCRALLAHPKLSVQQLAQEISKGKISFSQLPEIPRDKIEKKSQELAQQAYQKIRQVHDAEKDGLHIEVKNSGYDFKHQIETFQFHIALEEIWKNVKELNKDINEYEPWSKQAEERKGFLTNSLRKLNYIGYHLKPFIPQTAEKILAATQAKITKAQPLFPRLP